MEYIANNLKIQKKLISSKNILFIQDIDGVCIPLVKDPMTRELESKYIYGVKELAEEFFVLTCGEHEGPRGVNRIIERSLGSTTCLLYTSPSPRDGTKSRMPSSA